MEKLTKAKIEASRKLLITHYSDTPINREEYNTVLKCLDVAESLEVLRDRTESIITNLETGDASNAYHEALHMRNVLSKI